jgi:hypothetical protein
MPQAPADAIRAGGTTLAVPGRSNAHVSVASHGMFVVAAWAASEVTGATDIYAAASADGGATFSPPARVSGDAHRAHASGEQPPRVALLRRPGHAPGIVVVWISKDDAGTVLVTARSDDGAATFGPSEVVAGSAAAGNRGWHAIAPGADDQVSVAWLDHRRLAAPERVVGAEHQHRAGSLDAGADVDAASVAMAQLSDLYFSARIGGAVPPRPLTGGVCYCCKTTMGFGADGAISIAWRHVYDGNMRDIAFLRSPDGGRTFMDSVRVSEDRWSVAGCPDDGPVLAIDDRDRVHVVWPTVVTEDGKTRKVLFHAMSSDGARFTPRVRIPTEGQANHPQLAAFGDGLAVIWDEALGGARRIASARGLVDAAGRTTFARDVPAGEVEGVYPAVAFTADGGLVRAWTSGAPQSSVIRATLTPSTGR